VAANTRLSLDHPAARLAGRNSDTVVSRADLCSGWAEVAMTKELTDMASAHLQRKVTDPALRAKLTPSYPVGCKRPLQSRDWFPALCLPHVHLETSAIAEFTERGLRTADGVEHQVDTVIYGPGSMPPTICAASTCTAQVAGGCVTTGATAPRPI
jgi:cation diffusion facilitator CzcD-associated flavoprotein CzcO